MYWVPTNPIAHAERALVPRPPHAPVAALIHEDPHPGDARRLGFEWGSLGCIPRNQLPSGGAGW